MFNTIVALGFIFMCANHITMYVRLKDMQHEVDFVTKQYRDIYECEKLIYQQYDLTEKQYHRMQEIYKVMHDLYIQDHFDGTEPNENLEGANQID